MVVRITDLTIPAFERFQRIVSILDLIFPREGVFQIGGNAVVKVALTDARYPSVLPYPSTFVAKKGVVVVHPHTLKGVLSVTVKGVDPRGDRRLAVPIVHPPLRRRLPLVSVIYSAGVVVHTSRVPIVRCLTCAYVLGNVRRYRRPLSYVVVSNS